MTQAYLVIRSAGERSRELCCRLAMMQAGEDAVSVINERPFSDAVRVGFLRGIEVGCPWAPALDGDVLLHSQAIERLLEYTPMAPEGALHVHKLLNLAG